MVFVSQLNGVQVALDQEVFSPMSSDPTAITLAPNAAVGGDNWPPSSFDPEKNMYFVCSQSGGTGLVVPPSPQKFVEGQSFIGSDTVVSTGFDTTGFLTAYDMSTGKIAWQNEFKGESCYSGAVTTAGGPVFVGHNDGNLVAYDSERDGDSVRRRRRREDRLLRRRQQPRGDGARRKLLGLLPRRDDGRSQRPGSRRRRHDPCR
jgi:outer membrane protein assembly factor BamB